MGRQLQMYLYEPNEGSLMKSQITSSTRRQRSVKRRNELLLRFDRTRIEIGVFTAPRFRQKSEESEDDGNVVLVCGEKKRVERSQHRFIHLAAFGHVILPAGPDSGADHVHARVFHCAEVVVPNE